MSAHEHKPDSRLKQAEKIATHPEQYKVCEGCGSIVVTRAVVNKDGKQDVMVGNKKGVFVFLQE